MMEFMAPAYIYRIYRPLLSSSELSTHNDEDGGGLAETNDTKGDFPFSVESARSPPPLWQLRGQKRRMDPIRAISAPAVHCTSANFSHSQSEDEEV